MEFVELSVPTILDRITLIIGNTGCLTTDMNKVSAFFMEISPYIIENFDHILFTTDVSFIIKPYLGEKLKGNSENFHSKKNYFVSKNFFQFFEKIFHFKSFFGLIYNEKNFSKNFGKNF